MVDPSGGERRPGHGQVGGGHPGRVAAGRRGHEHVADGVLVPGVVAGRDEGDAGPVGAPGGLAVVVVAPGHLDRLGALGQGVDHEHLRAPVEGEAEVVHPVLEAGDPPGRLLLGRDVLAGAVAALLGHPGDIGDPGRVGAPGERLDPQRVLAQPARLAAVDGHHVQLRLVVVAGPQEGQPAAVGGEPGAHVAPARGEAAGRGRAVGGHGPDVRPVLVGLQVDPPDGHGQEPSVGGQGRGRRGAQMREIARLHAFDPTTHPRSRCPRPGWPSSCRAAGRRRRRRRPAAGRGCPAGPAGPAPGPGSGRRARRWPAGGRW